MYFRGAAPAALTFLSVASRFKRLATPALNEDNIQNGRDSLL